MQAIGTFRRPWADRASAPAAPSPERAPAQPPPSGGDGKEAFSPAEWDRARRRLAALTGDEDLLQAFDRVRSNGEIDGALLQRLDRYGIVLSDLFALPSGRRGGHDARS